MTSFNGFSGLTGAALTATLLPAALSAQSLPINDIRFYGHFTPAIVSFGDGEKQYSNVADNSYSGGRLGLWLDLPAGNGKLRFNIETSLGLRQSAAMSQVNTPPLIDLNAAALRKVELFLDTDRMGTFAFGQGSMATDGVTQSDLSGTQLAAYVGITDTAGGFAFRDASGALSNVTIANAYPTFDGGRAPRVRWDSPELALNQLGYFRVAVAAGLDITYDNVVLNDSLADAALFYRNTLGDFEVKTSLGTSLADITSATAGQLAGSFSLLHNPSGLNLTAAYGARANEGHYLYSKIGLTRRWSDWGDTALSVDLYRGVDTVEDGSEAMSYGLGIVQDIDQLNLQFYLGLRNYDYTGGGQSYQTASSVLFGTKWVFRKLEAIKLPDDWQDTDWSGADE
ncbi:porin [Chachezhania sediminis]|uniref:porin n=1 Tax=Chachezhania sediminis TaxID=2599291 RepID=UPI00131B4A29|nr:porin [Chachezhania sediminis]